jgi:hypothetical protein
MATAVAPQAATARARIAGDDDSAPACLGLLPHHSWHEGFREDPQPRPGDTAGRIQRGRVRDRLGCTFVDVQGLAQGEHRRAIEAAIKSGALEDLQARIGGNDVACWLGDAKTPQAVASWSKASLDAQKIKSAAAREEFMDRANVKLVDAIAG